jgi:hypothetical protein
MFSVRMNLKENTTILSGNGKFIPLLEHEYAWYNDSSFSYNCFYQFLGTNTLVDSYVHGLMDGEVFQDSIFQTQEFHLV